MTSQFRAPPRTNGVREPEIPSLDPIVNPVHIRKNISGAGRLGAYRAPFSSRLVGPNPGEFRRPFFHFRRSRFLPLHVHDSLRTDLWRCVSLTRNEDRQTASLGTEIRARRTGLKHCSFIEHTT